MVHQKLPQKKLDVKLIALDLDDTLLNRDLTISPRTVSALRAAAAQGIFVVICSGRAESGILPFVRQLDIAGLEAGRYVIALNGAVVFDLHTRQPIFSKKLDGDVLLEIFREAENADFARKCTALLRFMLPSIRNGRASIRTFRGFR